jgi:hypothetical protein
MHLTPQIDIISKSTNSPNDPISTISEISSPNFIKSNTNSKNPYHDLNFFSQLAPIILNLQFHLCYSSNTTQTKLLKEQKKKGGLEIIITSQDSVFGILDSQLKDIRINGSQPIWVLKFSVKKFRQGYSFISL